MLGSVLYDVIYNPGQVFINKLPTKIQKGVNSSLKAYGQKIRLLIIRRVKSENEKDAKIN